MNVFLPLVFAFLLFASYLTNEANTNADDQNKGTTGNSSGCAVLEVSDKSISISWCEFDFQNTTQFMVEMVPSPSRSDCETKSVNTTDCRTEIKGLCVAASYNITVKSSDKVENDSYICAVVTNPGFPEAPLNFIATALSSSQMNLSWAKPNVTNGPIDGYYVFWEGSDDYNDTRILGNIQTYHVNGLKPYTNYTFSVSAFNIHNSADLLGKNATQKETTFVAVPEAPLNFIATVLSSSQVSLSWAKPNVTNGPIDGYYVFWEESEDYNDTRILGHTQTYHVSGLKPYANYTFSVSAFNIHNGTDLLGENATQMQTTFVAVPEAPLNFIAEVVSSSEVNLSWAKPNVTNGPINGYYVFWEGSEDYNVTRILGNIQTYHVNGLKPYANYTFSVNAFNIHNSSDLPGENATQTETTFVAVPEAPWNFIAEVLSSSEVNLSWTKPNVTNGPINGYYVFWEGSEDCNDTRIVGNIQTYHVNGLKPYTNYTFSVSAFNIHNSTDLPGENATKKETTFVTVPEAPLNFIAVVLSSSEVNLSWTKPYVTNGPIDGYYVFWEGSEDYNDTRIFGNIQNYHVNGLKSYTNYTFSVSAFNIHNSKDLLGENATQKETTFVAVPEAPLNFIAVVFSSSEVSLSWTKPNATNGPIDGYYVFWEESEDYNYTRILGNTQNYHVSGLKPYTNYTFSVSAFNIHNDTDLLGENATQKETTFVAEPEAPSTVNATAVNSSTVDILWTKPVVQNGPIDGYYLFWSSHTKSGLHVGQNLSYTVTGLLPYENYTFYVQAYNLDENNKELLSENKSSSVRTHTSVPSSPKNLTIPTTTDSRITLTWEEPDNPNGPLDGYEITFISEYPEDNKTIACTTNLTYEGSNFKSWMNYTVSVRAYNYDSNNPGEKLFSEDVKSHTKTLPGIPGKPEKALLQAEGPDSLLASWTKPQVKSGPTNYTLELYKLESSSSSECGDEIQKVDNYNGCQNLIGWDTEQCTLFDLDPYTCYKVQVAAVTVTATNFSDFSSAVRTKVSTPSEARILNINVTLTSIELVWEKPDTPNGPLDGYKIVLQSVDDNSDVRKNTTKETTYFADWLNPGTKYNISVWAYNIDDQERELNGSISSVSIETRTDKPPIPDWEYFKNITQDVLKEEIATTDNTQDFLFLNSLFSEKNGKIEHYVALVSGKLQMDLKAQQGCETFDKANFPLWNETDATAMYRASPDYWNPLKDSFFYSINESPLPCRSTEDGDLFICTLGKQEDCGPGETFCNRPLEPNTEYLLKIRAYTKSGWSETNAMEFRTAVKQKPNHLPDDSSGSAGIVWGILTPLFLLFVIGGVAVYKFKDRIFKKQVAQKRDENGNGDIRNGDIVMKIMNTRIKISDFATRIVELHADSELLFSQEYEELKKRSSEFSKEVAILPENIKKNRFVNILPFDQTRVKLNVDEELGYKEYINANYIQTPGSKQVYIATQGPLPETVADFWRMIWENQVTTIVMLTQCVERGKVKCDKYWPDQGQSSRHGQMQVVSKSETFFSGNIIRMFSIQMGEEKRKVTQLYFTKWPDFNVPENPDLLINFVVAVRDHLPSLTLRPILAHCSAGVGRTGTYIAVDLIKERIHSGEEYVDIFNTVLDLRKCRQNMVQTEDQYIFIYDCVKEIIEKELSRKSKLETDCEEIYSNLQEIA